MKPADAARETILVIEDDRALRDGLVLNLRLQGYSLLSAADGEKGMRMAFDSKPDLIILDIMMPRWSGLEILDELRKRGENTPVLILSARDTLDNKIEGLHLGADDYMTKPFDLPELIARVEAMLRRRRAGKADEPDLDFGRIVIHRQARNVTVNGRAIKLSAKEFDLLCLLAAVPDHVFTREKILKQIWGWDYEGTERTVDNFVASLRKKLRTPACIQTVPQVGYKFVSS
jgi:two-component system alkaline phosphatase synthesis response regulator PhoP